MTAPDRGALLVLADRVEYMVSDDRHQIAEAIRALATPAAVTGVGEFKCQCGAPCRKEVLMRGGDNGWGDDASRTVLRYVCPASESVQGCDCAASVDGDADQRRHSADCSVYDRHTNEGVQGGEAVAATFPEFPPPRLRTVDGEMMADDEGGQNAAWFDAHQMRWFARQTVDRYIASRPPAAAVGVPPTWYTVGEIAAVFRAKHFDSIVANEIAEWVTPALQQSFDKGYWMAQRDAAPPPQAVPVVDDNRILWGLVANAGRLSSSRQQRWAHVVDATGQGSTSSTELCRRFGFDPDEVRGGGDSALRNDEQGDNS